MSTSRALGLITALLLLAATDCWAAIGTVTEQTGPTEIQRDKSSIPSTVNTGVEMNDAVVTAKAKVGITFQDDTKVEITEQSKMVIDEFVYDPSNADAGKLGLKVALGTARYASGQIAKDNPASVKIETPTATIGVRGTDFSMTVDELGRSLVILLPSCPVGYKNIERDCVTGQIDVTTDMGTVHLDKPFQATTTQAKEQNPAKPVILKLSSDQINNMMILSPPKQADDTATTATKTALDFNFLDKDLLKFDDLNIDFLAGNSKLDINALDTQFLFNMLDLLNSSLLESMLSSENQMLPNYKANHAAGLNYIKDDTNLTLYRTGTSSYVQVTVDKDAQTTVILNQDSTNMTQNVQRSGGTVIRIAQSQ
jgi:FecR protein